MAQHVDCGVRTIGGTGRIRIALNQGHTITTGTWVQKNRTVQLKVPTLPTVPIPPGGLLPPWQEWQLERIENNLTAANVSYRSAPVIENLAGLDKLLKSKLSVSPRK